LCQIAEQLGLTFTNESKRPKNTFFAPIDILITSMLFYTAQLMRENTRFFENRFSRKCSSSKDTKHFRLQQVSLQTKQIIY
jgi:hypothetical protein